MRNQERGRIAVWIGVAGAIILAAVLFLILMPPSIAVTIEDTDAARVPGEVVTLEVTISDNPGFTAMTAYVDYDHERLEFVGMEDTYTDFVGTKIPYLDGTEMQADVIELDDIEVGRIKVTANEPVKGKQKTVFALTFQIRPDAEIGVAEVALLGVQISCDKHGAEKQFVPTVTNGGILVGKSTCRHMDEEKDAICDLCGVKVISVEMIDIEDAYVTVEEGVKLNFVITSQIPKNRGYEAHIKKQGEIKIRNMIVPSDEWKKTDGAHYVISCPIYSTELTEPFSIEIENTDGYLYNRPYRTSVRELVMEKLNDETVSRAEKTMLVDLLNFGTAAEEYYEYPVQSPANSQLSEEQKAMATGDIVCADISSGDDRYMGSRVAFREQMQWWIAFRGFNGKAVSKMYAVAAYTDVFGEEKSVRVSGSEFEQYKADSSDAYLVPLHTVMIADAVTPVTVTVYASDGSVHGSGTDSVESFVVRNKTKALMPVYESLIKLAQSSKAWLTN